MADRMVRRRSSIVVRELSLFGASCVVLLACNAGVGALRSSLFAGRSLCTIVAGRPALSQPSGPASYARASVSVSVRPSE